MSIKKTDFLKFGEDLYEVIPPAPSEEDRGGIIASPVTEAETIEAKLGDDGKLYVGADPAGSAAAALALANENTQTKIDEISSALNDKADTATLTSHTSNTTIHVTQNDKDKWDLAEPNQRAFTRVEVNDDGYSASNSIASTMRFKNGTGIELSITNKDSDADVTITNTGVTGVKGDSESTYRTGNVNITKANIGLSNVDNTKDTNKPVSTAQQTAIDNALSESKDYTDEKVALLLNNSSAAVDSIMELATAMEENEEVVDALEQAIGNKADKTHSHAMSDITGLQAKIDSLEGNKVDNSTLSNYYTKTQIDELELITVSDIDAICGTTIQMASEVMF